MTASAAAAGLLASSPSQRLRRQPGIPDDSWHVTEQDLHSFRAAVEDPKSLASWGEPMLTKDFGTMTYKAWRRSLPDGKTEYKSVTVAKDSTAEEFSDFFLDDDARGGVRHGEDQGSGWVSYSFPFFFFLFLFPFSFSFLEAHSPPPPPPPPPSPRLSLPKLKNRTP